MAEPAEDRNPETQRAPATPPPAYAGGTGPRRQRSTLAALAISTIRLAIRVWPITLIGSFLLYQSFQPKPPPPATSAPYFQTPPQEVPSREDSIAATEATARVSSEYVRPGTAPNGEAWPDGPAYLRGEEVLNGDGLSTVTVDNSQNTADVLVKLVALSASAAYTARQFYIPAGSRFTLENVQAGDYDVRYRDLDTGQLVRSDPFTLEELEVADGTQYSNMTLTLYKVSNGNMQTHDLAESDF